MTNKIVGFILMAGVLFFFNSCFKENTVSTNEEEIFSLTEEFDFKTVTEASIDILLLNPQNEPVEGVYIELYTENPLYDNGQKIEDIEKKRVYAGITDSIGGLYCKINPPSYIDSVYVFINHAGFPVLTGASLVSNPTNLTIGGSTNSLSTKSATLISGQNVVEATVVNGYYVLGDWNSVGVPDYLETNNDIISNEFMADITASLPEYFPLTETHPQYLEDSDDGNIFVVSECEIWVTFVHEGAGWLNSLGYYSYPTGNVSASVENIENKTIIFPNVSFLNSGGGLVSGNKVQLLYLDPVTEEFTTIFPAGTTVSWFLVARGWENGTVTDGVYTHYSITEFNEEPNPDLKKHNVLLFDNERDLLLLGFEDVRRDNGSDQDFNDAIFYATANPIEAIKTDVYQPIDTPTDTDGDGTSDTFDFYPEDPTRSFDNSYPGTGEFGTLAYEDQWPLRGDYDFNDLVLDYNFTQITNSKNQITGVEAKIVVKATGASYHNGFAISLDVPPGIIESVAGNSIEYDYLGILPNGTIPGDNTGVVVIFDDAFNVLEYPGSGIGVNTTPGHTYVTPDTLHVIVTFKNPVPISNIGTPPYNPFVMANRQADVEIHLPNNGPTNQADNQLFGTGQDSSDSKLDRYYLSNENLPWAINIPENFDYPIEKINIRETHLKFFRWAQSQGTEYQDWYMDKPGYRNDANIYSK